MRLLTLEPYYAGSHRAFLDGWLAHSHHDWTTLTLPGYKWKWRMRHAAFTFAEEIASRYLAGERWDALFATDMLDLPQLLTLTRPILNRLPAVVYFHENQLTYPSLHQNERDYHFAMTNFATAAAANHIWFNSDFHRREFLTNLRNFLKRMPDYPPLTWIDRISQRSAIYPQGIGPPIPRPPRRPGPLRILWAARWEHDKNPDDFFAALHVLRCRGLDFRLNVIGEQFDTVPTVFATAREEFNDRIDRWGYRTTREEYERTLVDSDVIVSTARHEFFGVTVVEAAAAGVFPVLPRRLAYQEIFPPDRFADLYYDGSVSALVDKLALIALHLDQTGTVWPDFLPTLTPAIKPFFWPNLAPVLDDAIAVATDLYPLTETDSSLS